MHDIRAIRDDPAAFDRAWARRGLSGQTKPILALDAELRAAQTALQDAQARRNEASKLIGVAKGRNDEAEAARLMGEVADLKGVMETQAATETRVSGELRDLLSRLPNLPADDVPEGPDEESNQETKTWGTPFAIENPKDHVALGEALKLMDFEAAARMSGARFVVLKGQLARLERALGQFMLDMQTVEHGYTEVSPPLLVRDEAMFGTGQLPKFEADLFKTDIDPEADALAYAQAEWAKRKDAMSKSFFEMAGNFTSDRKLLAEFSTMFEQAYQHTQLEVMSDAERKLASGYFTSRKWLIPTAEVSLTNLVREQITDEGELPLRLTALTPCFRSEAGASGRDTRGMIRQHQFQKVELVSIVAPEASKAEHERMTDCAEAVLKRLELPFRTMLLCAGDMGFSAAKTYDLEVWLPSQAKYREISSCSNCGDFQARRMDARIKKSGEKGTRFAHTLNGSGLAVGRTLVAIIENYQDEGGRIAIPQALHPYMRGLTHIGGQG